MTGDTIRNQIAQRGIFQGLIGVGCIGREGEVRGAPRGNGKVSRDYRELGSSVKTLATQGQWES